VSVKYQLYLNGEFATVRKSSSTDYWEMPFGDINFNLIDNWISVDDIVRQVSGQFRDKTVEIRKLLAIDGKLVPTYIVNTTTTSMMGRQQGRFHGFAATGGFSTGTSSRRRPSFCISHGTTPSRCGSCRWGSAGTGSGN